MNNRFLCFFVVSAIALKSTSVLSSEVKSPYSVDNCPTVKIETTNMPDNIFNGERAGSLGWCFAHSTADVLSFHIGQKLSAQDIAAHFFNSETYKMYFKQTAERILGHAAGGHVSYTIKELLNKKVCYEKDSDFFAGDWPLQSRFMKALVDTKSDSLKSFQLKSFDLNHLKSPVQNLPPEQRLNYIFENTCRNDGPIPVTEKLKLRQWGLLTFDVEEFSIGTMENIIMLNEGLVVARKPVSIGFDMSLLAEDKVDVLHAATIVGQEMRDGICKYTIRNNSGYACRDKVLRLQPGVSCDENSDLFFVDREMIFKKVLFGLWLE